MSAWRQRVVVGAKTRGRWEGARPSDIRSHCSDFELFVSSSFRNASAGGRRRTERATSHGLPTLGTCQLSGATRLPWQKDMNDECHDTTRALASRKSQFTRRYLTHYRIRFARWNLKLTLRREKRRKALYYSFRATLLEILRDTRMCLKVLCVFVLANILRGVQCYC